MVDYIGTIENLQNDFRAIQEAIGVGVGIGDLVHVNKGRKETLSQRVISEIQGFVDKYYAIDQSLWKKERFFKEDDQLESEIFQKFENEDDPRLLFVIGESCKKQGGFRESIECFSKAISFLPEYHAAHQQLSSIFLESGQIDAALQASEKALAIYPNNPIYRHHHGNLLLAAGEYSEAEKCQESAIALRPEHAGVIKGLSKDKFYPAAILGLAKAYRKQDLNLKAIDLLSSSLNDIPQNHSLRMLLVDVLIEEGDFERAEVELREAILYKPISMLSYRILEKLLDETGRSAIALETAKQATQYCSHDRRSWANLGNRYLKYRMYPQAMETFEKGIKEVGNCSSLLMGVSRAWEKTGGLVEAKASAQKALSVDPKNPKIMKLLNRLEALAHIK